MSEKSANLHRRLEEVRDAISEAQDELRRSDGQHAIGTLVSELQLWCNEAESALTYENGDAGTETLASLGEAKLHDLREERAKL